MLVKTIDDAGIYGVVNEHVFKLVVDDIIIISYVIINTFLFNCKENIVN